MRGRTVVASLAMSVALLVITGSVALYFDPIESRASTRAGVTANADVSVSFHTSGGEDLASYEADMASAADEATALGAERVGSFRQGQFEGVIPASMVTQAGRDTIEYREDATAMTGATWIAPPFTSQGDFAGAVTTFFIDDASWRAWVAELGLDEEAFCDPENPQAIALNHFTGTGPAGVYTDVAPFAATGEITMCYGVQPREGYTSLGVQESEGGELVIAYLKQEVDGYEIDESGNAIGAEVVEVPVAEAAQTATLVVGALADDAPAVLSVGYPTGHLPTVILPLSAAEAFGAAAGSDAAGDAAAETGDAAAEPDGVGAAEAGAASGGTAADVGSGAESAGSDAGTASDGESAGSAQATDSYDYSPSPFTYWWGTELFAAENHAEVADALDGAIASTGALSEGLSAQVNDITEEAEQNRMVSQAIQLFLLCFSVITMLVAVANVFNTLTNSIILRTREFAVLKSVGMDDKAFARMLLCECASYALRGFVAGVVIALGVTGLLYWATSLSFAGLSFAVPWAYVGAAAVVVCLVLAASVVFALHKSHAGSVVEALRAEAV